MPLFEYVLLALLGSGATGAAPAITLSAGDIIQPNGGAMSAILPIPQDKQDDVKKVKPMYKTSRHHRHGKHGRHTYKKKTEGEKKGG